jgi:hypothetical protein
MVKKKKQKRQMYLKEVLELVSKTNWLNTSDIQILGMEKGLYTNYSSYKFILGKLEELKLVISRKEEYRGKTSLSWKRN